MTTMYQCNTEMAAVLLGGKDSRGVFRLWCKDKSSPLMPFLNRPATPIIDQLLAQVHESSGISLKSGEFVWHVEFHETTMLESARQATIYLITVKDRCSSITCEGPQWHSIPEIIRAMPKGKLRLQVLKTMQLLSGASHEEIQAVEITSDQSPKLPN